MKLERIFLVLSLTFFAFVSTYASANVPDWWYQYKIANQNALVGTVSNDIATIGQLKYISRRAADVLNEKFADKGGAGSEVNAMVNSYALYSDSNPSANYEAVTIGQVKYVAKKFYDRLFELGEAIIYPDDLEFFPDTSVGQSSKKYPWQSMGAYPLESDYAKNYEPATVSNIKNLFVWSVSENNSDKGSDGISNSWYDALNGEYSELFANASNFKIIPISATCFNESAANIILKIIDSRGNPIKNVPICFVGESVTFSSSRVLSDVNGLVSITALAQGINEYFVAFIEGIPESRQLISMYGVEEYPLYSRDLMPVYKKVDLDKSVFAEIPIPPSSEPEYVLPFTNHLKIMQNEYASYTALNLTNHVFVDGEYVNGVYSTENYRIRNTYLGWGVVTIYHCNNTEFTDDMDLMPDANMHQGSSLVLSMIDNPNPALIGFPNNCLQRMVYSISEDNLGRFVSYDGPIFAFKVHGLSLSQPGTFHSLKKGTLFGPWVYGMTLREGKGRYIRLSEEGRLLKIQAGGSVRTVSVSTGFEVSLNNYDWNKSVNISTGNEFYIRAKSGIPIENGRLIVESKFDSFDNGGFPEYWNPVVFDLVANNYTPAVSLPTSEITGSMYRKIGLDGRPLSTDAPEETKETDVIKPDVYIDSFTRQFNYDSYDVKMNIPNSDLVLGVRRNYNSASWNFASGLRPHERITEPMGPNWNTNISIYAKLEQQNDFNLRTSPDTITVIDENAIPHTFAIVYNRAGSQILKFYPLPTNKTDATAFLNKLYFDNNGNLIFKKRYGTEITYESISLTHTINASRHWADESTFTYKYYRAKTIKDRFNTKLSYEYGYPNNPLLPSKIKALSPCDTEIAYLIIQENNYGKVQHIYTSSGNQIDYGYNYAEYNKDAFDYAEMRIFEENEFNNISVSSSPDDFIMKPCVAQLTGVNSATKFVSYQYNFAEEKNIMRLVNASNGSTQYNEYHSDITKIEYGNDLKVEIEYEPFISYFDKNDYYNNKSLDALSEGSGYFYSPSGKPRKVSKITRGRDCITEFSSDSAIFLRSNSNREGVFDLYTNNGKFKNRRITWVKDANGNKIKYTWFDDGSTSFGSIRAEAIVSYADVYGMNLDYGFSCPRMIYYSDLKVDFFNGNNSDTPSYTEICKFDDTAGMAIKSYTDLNGNTTSYIYNDEIASDIESDEDLPFVYNAKKINNLYSRPKYPEPTSKMNALGKEALYTYFGTYRIMNSQTDENKNKTTWSVDSLGRRISEIIENNIGRDYRKTTFTYDSIHKNFVSETNVESGAGGTKNIQTQFFCDENGRLEAKYQFAQSDTIITSYTYDSWGNKITETLPNGGTIAYHYNLDNCLTMKVIPDGSITSYEYHSNGLLAYIAKNYLYIEDYFYDEVGNISEIQIYDGISDTTLTRSYLYDKLGNKTLEVDERGFCTVNTYDQMQRLIEIKKYQTYGENSLNEAYYCKYLDYGINCGAGALNAKKFNPTFSKNANGYITYYEYDKLYRLTQKEIRYSNTPVNISDVNYTDDGVQITKYSYDNIGNKIRETDDNSWETTYEYDTLGNLVKTIYFDGTQKTSEYSSTNLLLQETDELGNTTNYTYDTAGRLIQKDFPEVFDFDSKRTIRPFEKYDLDLNGNVICKTDSRGNAIYYTYDLMGRVICEESPAIEVVDSNGVSYLRPIKRMRYDMFGNLEMSTDANNNVSEYLYDTLARLVSTTFKNVTYHDGQSLITSDLTETISYLEFGRIVDSTDKSGRVTRTEFNYLNKPISVTRNYGTTDARTELMEYDGEGNMTAVVDGKGNRTQYTYDGLNRCTLASYGVGGDAQRERPYYYGSISLMKDIGVKYQYDTRNRLKRTESYYGDRIDYNYTYDATGKIAHCEDVWNMYDAMGRIVSETSNGYEHRYQYDGVGNRRMAQYGIKFNPNSAIPYGFEASHSVVTSYDNNNRVTSIRDDKGRTVFYLYDLNGNVIGQMYPNGVNISRTFDSFNRVTSILTTKDEATLLRCEYRYDINGNVIYVAQNFDDKYQVVENTYDNFDRLATEKTSVQGKPQSEYIYIYDNADNIVIKKWYKDVSNTNTIISSYFYNSLNQLIDYVDELGSSNWEIEYDAMGNMVRDGNGHYLFYDGYGRISSYTGAGMGIHYCSYDYRGRRIWHENIPVSIQDYSYSGSSCVVEKNALNPSEQYMENPNLVYYRGPDMGGGVGGINYACNPNDSELNYKHYNLRGDVIMTTSSTGIVTNKWNYTAYGDDDSDSYTTTIRDRHRANTKVSDFAGLILDGHRYRDPYLMRFLSPDPLEYVDGLNCYTYCNNNPWGRFDPDGLLTMALHYRPLKDWGNILSAFVDSARHSSIVMNFTKKEYESIQGLMSDSQKEDIIKNKDTYTFTISGFSSEKSDKLDIVFNNPSDNPDKTKIMSTISSKDGDDMAVAKKFIKDSQNLKDKNSVKYAGLPRVGSEGNCNSLTGTMIERAGAKLDDRKEITKSIKVSSGLPVSIYKVDNINSTLSGFDHKIDYINFED